jgi:hypothetical protein
MGKIGIKVEVEEVGIKVGPEQEMVENVKVGFVEVGHVKVEVENVGYVKVGVEEQGVERQIRVNTGVVSQDSVHVTGVFDCLGCMTQRLRIVLRSRNTNTRIHSPKK